MKTLFLTILCLIATAFCLELKGQACKPIINYTIGPNGTVNFNVTSPVINPGSNILWLFGDGGYDTSFTTNPTHVYAYNYPTYEACITYDDPITQCYDSSCVQFPITNATPMNCQGTASFTYAPNGTQTRFTNNNSFYYWRIIDLGFGPSNYQPFSYSTDIDVQYTLNGTYNVTAVSIEPYGNSYYVCDTFTTSVNVNNVGCNLQMHYEIDTISSYFIQTGPLNSIGYTNYKWYIDGVFYTSNTYLQTPYYFPEGTYTISVAATGPNGCQDSVWQTIDFYYTLPCNNTSASVTRLSNCDDFQLNASGTGSLNYTWLLDNAVVSNNASTVLTIPFPNNPNTGYHNLICYISGANCMDSYYFIEVNPASFNYDLDTSGSINTWYVYYNSNLPITNHYWDFGDGFTSTLASPTHIYANGGYYTVCHSVTTSNGCNYNFCSTDYFYRPSNVSTPFQIIVYSTSTGLEEKDIENVKIYPNPLNSEINITGNIENFKDGKIMDLGGRIVKTFEFEPSITITELNSGLYVLDLTDKLNNHVRLKFVKQ